MTEALLTIDGLTIRDRVGASLVDGVTLRIPKSGAMTLIGETGSGKSLIAQAIFGLLPASFAIGGWLRRADGVSISFADRDRLRDLWRSHTMLLPQEPTEALDPTMRVGRQLSEIPPGDRCRVANALELVNLSPDVARLYPFELSGGMSQRILVAAAHLARAPILVADEPTKGLDPARAEMTVTLLRSLLAPDRALLVITHDPVIARSLPGTIAMLKDGRIVEHGSSEAVIARPRDPYTRSWLAADPAGWPIRSRAKHMAAPVLAAQDLSFAWPRQAPLFAGLSLSVRPGEITAISGPSGCGKTTLGNVLLGLTAPTQGQVSWAGLDPYADQRARRAKRRRYQKLHQDPIGAFIPHRMIGAQLKDLGAVIPGFDDTARLPPLLERLKLKPALLARYPSEVSGGEAQRLALLRLLLLDPSVIVADEPTSRLDPIIQRDVIDLLRDCVERDGMAVILISHDRALVRAVADEVCDLGTFSAACAA